MKNKKKCRSKTVDQLGSRLAADVKGSLFKENDSIGVGLDRVKHHKLEVAETIEFVQKKSKHSKQIRTKEMKSSCIFDKMNLEGNDNSNAATCRVTKTQKQQKPKLLPALEEGHFNEDVEDEKINRFSHKRNCDLTSPSDEELLPFHIPVIMNDINKVCHYFERDARTGKSRCNPNIRCLSDRSTPLLIAIRSKKTEAAKILLVNGADVTLTDNSGDNALLAAVKTQDANIINLLWPYRKDLNVNHTNNHGLSALHMAADRQWEGCLNFLLQNKADPNCMSSTGETPLMLAASKGDTKTVDNLLKANAEILIEDFNGNTCICKAFEKDKKDMALYLLQKIPDYKKDLFIKSRLDLLVSPVNPEDEKRLLENSYYPILHQCTGLASFRNSFYSLKAIPKIVEKLQEYNQNFELTLLASHLIFCIMFRFTLDVDVKFVRQFIKCRGPEAVMHITKYYTEQWKIPEREIISIFLPMIGLSELTEGRLWLKKNYVHVSEYLNHFDKSCLSHCLAVNSDCHWCPECDYHKAISLAWDRFHFVIDSIQTEERERHMSELLEEEAREKERQMKKLEKKKQKKQVKLMKTEEMSVVREISIPENSVDDLCKTIAQFGNANTNAGQDISKLVGKNRSISESSNLPFCSPPLSASTQNMHNSHSYNNQIFISTPSNCEQWTTIQTKRQIQKEKRTPKKEKILSESSEFTRKTPRKSPKKRNIKHPQILHGQTFVSGPVSGTTRWADIAKSSPRKPDTTIQKQSVIKQTIQTPAVRNISFASIDFPSLCIQTEGNESPEKSSNTKPAKITYHFHDPISESCKVEIGTQGVYHENSKLVEDVHHTQIEKTLSSQQCNAHAGIWDDVGQSHVDHNTGQVYFSEAEANNSEYYSDDDLSTENSSQVIPANAVIQDEDIYESETYPEDDDNSQEDWSNEIAEIEAACAIRSAYSDEPSYQPKELREKRQPLQVHTNEEPVIEHIEPIAEKEEYAITEVSVKTEYVGPENCQVDLLTLFQHQTESFPYFMKLVSEDRVNDPYYDPTIPIPKVETDSGQPKSVDVLFDKSEEIPSWYTDNESQSHEETWDEMQRNSKAYANLDVSTTPQSDFSTVDPAILVYKNLMEHPHIPKNEALNQPQFSIPKSQDPPQYSSQNRASILHTVNPTAGQVYQEKENRSVHKPEDNASYSGVNFEVKQTAVIKPLPNIRKNQVPVLNSPFGQSILQNACQLEHLLIEDEVGYPDELDGVPYPDNDGKSLLTNSKQSDDGEEATDDLVFPGFHTNTQLSGQINENDFSMFHKMQQIQYGQLAKYYNQNKKHITGKHPLGSHQDNFVYYAQCAGMDGQTLDNCLSGNIDFQPQKVTNPTTSSRTFKDIYVEDPNRDCNYNMIVPNTPTQNSRGQSRPQPPATHTPNRPTPASPMSPVYPYGQYASPAQMHPANIHLIQATQAAMAATVMSQIKEMYKSMLKAKMKSVRWKDDLWKMRNLPPERQMVVGKIIIPKEEWDRIYISNVSSGSVVLGFLSDGTEVAVKIIDWKDRDFTLDELQHLVNLDVSKYFMNKYMAFCSQDGFYYIAMTLYEYSLPEYMSKLGQDNGVDMTIARNKLVWQFMRGLASLHQHCLMVHGDLKPENVVIDLDGNIKIMGYGICKNSNREAPFVEYSEEDKCWLAPEILVHKQKVSFKSDIFVAGMLMYYILSGGLNTFGVESLDIIRNITQHSYIMDYVTEEAGHLLSLMLSVNKSERPCISDALRHPYFWADEKRLRFILIAGSDVLRDLKSGIPMDGSVRDSMINIIGSSPCNINIINWIPDIEPIIINEMRVFRQYKNNVVELVLFIYNCCLHFDKMSDAARSVIDEPCKYFLTKFPTLFMFVYRAIKMSNRTDRTCYKPFF